MKPEDIQECVRVLEALVEDRAGLGVGDGELRNRLLIAASSPWSRSSGSRHRLSLQTDDVGLELRGEFAPRPTLLLR